MDAVIMTAFNAAEDLKTLLSSSIIGGCDLTDNGGLSITYADGMVYDASNDVNVVINGATTSTTDNATRYLIWSSGNSLTLSASTATGNQVLIAKIIAAAADITSITEYGFCGDTYNGTTWTHGVTGLTNRPLILLAGEEDNNLDNTYGTILIGQENLNNFDQSQNLILEAYRVQLDIVFNGTGTQTFKNIARQIRALLRTNNLTLGHEWYYTPTYSWKGQINDSIMNMVIDCQAWRGS